MKIEIAESLTYSFLKHSEGCRIVQTNWSASGKWVTTDYDTQRARELFDKISSSEHFSGIFKNSSFDQLIKQAEIDVLGINPTESTIYGIDVAFHSAGLNYGSKEESALRIMKKIFRTIFVMQSYFDDNEKFNSYFITPRVNNPTKDLIDDYMEKAKEIINDENISIEFISNERFYSEIADPILKNLDDEHDTTELFSRAIKLIKLDCRKENATHIETSPITQKSPSEKREMNGMKIGQFVRHSFKEAFEQNLISDNEIDELQKPEYSKRVFNSNFEILKNINEPIKDESGRTRYYAKDTFCGEYHLTSQWFEYQWDYLLKWLDHIGYDYKSNTSNNI